MITAGSKVRIEKGCNARNVAKGTSATVESVTPLGPEYSHAARVVLKMRNGFRSGQIVTFYARHPNRLGDPIVNLNDGNPRNTIQIRAIRLEAERRPFAAGELEGGAE